MKTKYLPLAAALFAAPLLGAMTSPVMATPVTVAGSYTITQTAGTGSEPQITGVFGTQPANTFSQSLNLNTPTNLGTLIDITPPGSPGISFSNSFTCGFGTCNSATISDTINAIFTFTAPSATSPVTVTESGTFTATYYQCKSGLCFGVPGDTDAITWNSPDPFIVHFNDGAILNVTLNNDSDWTLNPTISFDLTQDPSTSVPEPASLVLLGTALAGFGMIRRRRRAAA